jgi:hypothetical protein
MVLSFFPLAGLVWVAQKRTAFSLVFRQNSISLGSRRRPKTPQLVGELQHSITTNGAAKKILKFFIRRLFALGKRPDFFENIAVFHSLFPAVNKSFRTFKTRFPGRVQLRKSPIKNSSPQKPRIFRNKALPGHSKRTGKRFQKFNHG